MATQSEAEPDVNTAITPSRPSKMTYIVGAGILVLFSIFFFTQSAMMSVAE